MNNVLGDLVKKAKGNDRTIKEYAADSGVDAAIISKIITGKYVPKRPKMYQKLTSLKAAPRGGVTYEQLLDAADYSASYKEGLLAGVAASGTIASMVGGLPAAVLQAGVVGATVASATTKKKRTVVIGTPETEKRENSIQRFIALAIGVVYGSMARKGISFRPEKGLEGNKHDTYVSVENQYITDYVFKYVYVSESERKSELVIENVGKKAIEQLIFLKPEINKKISLVVNCKEVYDFLYKYKDRLSYKGNLSVVLIDVDKVSVEMEEYLAYYSDDVERENAFKIV